MTRKLATIRKIKDIREIPTADKICSYLVDGWWVVDSINKYKIDEEVIYVEIDSWVPHSIAPFLSKGREPREYNGILGERLKTQKFLNTLSQGLLLPISVLNEDIDKHVNGDYSSVLNIQKWEAPIPAQLSGKVKGNFPGYIPKTDQERCQNLYVEIFGDHAVEYFEVTEKLEGSSMTVYVKDGEVGVCSRNWDLTEDDRNTLWKVARDIGLVDYLKNYYNRNIAIQGELIGEGIQKNYYGIKGHQFHVFDVYDIDAGGYWNPVTRKNWIGSLPLQGLHHVPVVDPCYDMTGMAKGGIDGLLVMAEGKSVLNPQKQREGIVFKSYDTDFHFKSISNRYLLKQKD